MSLTRTACGVSMAVLLAMRSSGPVKAQAPQSVDIPVLIERSDGSPVTVPADRLHVHVGDRTPGITRTSVDDGPVTVFLLLDASYSTLTRLFDFPLNEANRLGDLIDRRLLSNLRPGDHVRVGAFGPRLRVVGDYETDRRKQLANVRQALTLSDDDRIGPVALWDALLDAVADIRSQSGRRAIVFVGDGRGTGNVHSSADALHAAGTSLVPVHVVSAAVDLVIPLERSMSLRVRSTDTLRELAKSTGGLFLQPPGADREFIVPSLFLDQPWNGPKQPPAWHPDPREALERIAAVLHRTTTVTINVDGLPSGRYPLEVRTDDTGVQVHAPTGVVVGRP